MKYGDDDLFRLLGPFLCSRQVHKELEYPIYSHDGDVWFVYVEGVRVLGFCAVRDDGRYYWFDYSYVIPDARRNGIHTALARARDEWIRNNPGKDLRVCVHENRWQHYDKRGWKKVSKRGKWIYASRETVTV